MHTDRHVGFTLVELLVVISIIAVLVAILIPVLAKARESSRTAACISNQRQMAAALLMWAQDNDEMLPPADTIWQNLDLTPKILICPTAGKARRNGYVYNAFVADKPLGDASFEGNEAHIIVTADGSGVGNIAVKRRDVDLRHNGKAIAAFLDGHAQKVRFEELATYHVGQLVYKPIPFTSNGLYTAIIRPEGTTIARASGTTDWYQHIMSDVITDVPEGSFCRMEFIMPYPDRPVACGISFEPPYMSHGFTCYSALEPIDFSRISFWERPPFDYVQTLNRRYVPTSLYALERQPDGKVSYLVDEQVIYTSGSTTTMPLQFHFNGYMVGSEVRNLRYCVE
ncbi:MAG: type II secretion system protein [Armatimonadota bacterium]